MLSNNVDAVLDQIEAQQADRFELEPNATSLTLLQKVYRSPAVALPTRMRAAMAALQFEHPKLAVAVTVNSGDFADQLDRAIERSRMALIEGKPIANTDTASDISSDTVSDVRRPSTSVKPLTIPDRRYRKW
jgi:hypothetical protein